MPTLLGMEKQSRYNFISGGAMNSARTTMRCGRPDMLVLMKFSLLLGMDAEWFLLPLSSRYLDGSIIYEEVSRTLRKFKVPPKA